MRSNPSLPDGYRVREVKGRPYLFDPRGILLPGPKDPALIEAYAWRHAWRQVDRELNQELMELQAGVRPLRGSRRLRQYLRMLDAMGQVGRHMEERPVRWRLFAGGALAASAAAAAVFVVAATLVPQSAPRPDALIQRARALAFKHAAPASPGGPRTSGTETVRPSAARGEAPPAAVRAARPALPRFALGTYAITFGTFVNRTAADAMMHFVRSKGYIVYVARIGEEFRVVTRPYRTREQAERLVGALQEIRLPAQLTTSRNRGRLTARVLEAWPALRD